VSKHKRFAAVQWYNPGMQKDASPKVKSKLNNKKTTSIIVLAVVVGLVLLLILLMQRPERSVAAYCKVYNVEKTRLTAMSNNSNPYPSGLNGGSLDDSLKAWTQSHCNAVQ
jgi:hypothetical protein